MGLRINTNSSAVTALRNLHVADRAQAKSLERLSTGLRINRASDDPSGLVISEQLRAQISSLKQAMENTESASNLIGTAEAALAEISGLLIGIRESALFALNEGGTSAEQIGAEQDAVDAAIGAIDRIAGSTRFGRTQLLDGSAQIEVTSQSNEIAAVNVKGLNFDGFASRNVDINITVAATRAHFDSLFGLGDGAIVTGGDAIFRISGSKGTQTVTLGANADTDDLMDAVNLVSLNTGIYSYYDFASDLILDSIAYGSDEAVTFEQIGGSGVVDASFEFNSFFNADAVDVEGTIEGVQGHGEGNTLSLDSFALNVEVEMALDAAGDVAYFAGNQYTFVAQKSGLNFQLNSEANPNDATRIGIAGVHSALLGSTEIVTNIGGGNTLTIGGIVATLRSGSKNDLETDAGNAIRIIDAAIDDVSDMRATLGALKSNILDSNTRSLGVAIENLTSSESGIRDLDFAAETAEFTRTQIMFQAGTAVMASANLIPQTILSLLQ